MYWHTILILKNVYGLPNLAHNLQENQPVRITELFAFNNLQGYTINVKSIKTVFWELTWNLFVGWFLDVFTHDNQQWKRSERTKQIKFDTSK